MGFELRTVFQTRMPNHAVWNWIGDWNRHCDRAQNRRLYGIAAGCERKTKARACGKGGGAMTRSEA